MCFVNSINMKILVTGFLCTSISAVHFTGSNSSLFESKIVGGKDLYSTLILPFIVTIMGTGPTEHGGRFVAMGTFYSKNAALTSEKCAKDVESNKHNYLVQTSPIYGSIPHYIDKVYYRKDENTKKSGRYGILKLQGEAAIDLHEPIKFITTNQLEFLNDARFYSAGWGWNENGDFILKYLSLKIISRETCQETLAEWNPPRKISNIEICLYAEDGYFDSGDDGTALYATDNTILGIANTVSLYEGGITICSLLSGRKKQIEGFLSSNQEVHAPQHTQVTRLDSSLLTVDDSGELQHENREFSRSNSYTPSLRINTRRDRSISPVRTRRTGASTASSLTREMNRMNIDEQPFTCKSLKFSTPRIIKNLKLWKKNKS